MGWPFLVIQRMSIVKLVVLIACPKYYTVKVSGQKDKFAGVVVKGHKKTLGFKGLVVVTWLGLEPRTLSLKGRCSTN